MRRAVRGEGRTCAMSLRKENIWWVGGIEKGSVLEKKMRGAQLERSAGANHAGPGR